MTFQKILVALAATAALSAFAQTPPTVGTVISIEGTATATEGATGSTVLRDMPVRNGMRIVTTNSGVVRLRMASGCVVEVPPAHGVTVLGSMTCAQLHAAVQPVVNVGAGVLHSPNAAIVNGVVILGAAGIVTGIIHEVTTDEPLSGK